MQFDAFLVTSATEVCTTQCLILILGDQFDDMARHQKWHATFKSDMEFTVPALQVPRPLNYLNNTAF